jgi:hypothetical protein
VGKLGQISLREAVEFFLRHNRADVPRLTLAEIEEQFAKSREQSGLSAHYVSQCRKTVNDLAKAFPGKPLPDLRTAELDAWPGGLTFGAKTKNGMRIILVACGNWAEGRGYLIKGGSPFPVIVRYNETKTSVSIFAPENIASWLTKADKDPATLPRPGCIIDGLCQCVRTLVKGLGCVRLGRCRKENPRPRAIRPGRVISHNDPNKA